MGNYGLKDLLKAEGYPDELTFIEEMITDSVSPGICEECGYTIDVEPDQQKGWCEICETGTVVSGMVLAGIC